MNVRHLLPIAFSAIALICLPSCESTGPIDARYPSVDELDRLDVQWGMKPRKSRGTPTRTIAASPSFAPAAAPQVAPIDPTPPSAPAAAAPTPPPSPTPVAPALR